MLEGLVAGLLNRFLGMYVKNFDPTQLKVGIWSGDVKLRLPETSNFRLDASTVSGDMHSDFALSGGENGLGSLTGQTGDGGAAVSVSTTSGEISVERRE